MTTGKSKVFTAVTEDFTRAVRWASKLVGKDNALISIKIEDGVMFTSAYNGVNSSKSKSEIEQKFDGELEFSVNGTLLSNAIKALKDSSINCSVDGRTLTIKSAKAKFALPITMPRNKLVLPPMPPKLGAVDAKDFKLLLGHATSMTSDDPSTPSLMTVHMEISPQNKEIRLMATDRYKLVIRRIDYVPAKDSEEENFTLDVDARSFKVLMADLGDAPELTLYASAVQDNRQFGIANSTQIGSVAMKDVKPINYAQFSKMANDFSVVFKRSDLTGAISVTKPLITGSVKTADIIMNADEMTLVSEMTDMDVDMASSDLQEELSIHMNLDYLTPVLSAGKSEFVKFSIQNDARPVIIMEMKDENTVDEDYFSLVMPTRKQ